MRTAFDRTRSGRKCRIACIATMLALSCLAFFLAGCGQNRQPVHRGDPAPEIQATDLQGNAITLDDYKGKVILVLFWAEACCADAIPAIADLFHKYKDAGFAVVAINPVEPRERVERVVKTFNVDFVVGLDQLKLTQRRYDVHGVPCSFLVDHSGVIREKILGDIPKHKLESKLQALLK